MNETDLISVIIPVHNGGETLNKTIRGILKQTYDNLELILVPNNCQDNSIEICDDWAKKDKRVKVFINYEKSTSLARKRGVLESKGKYIIFSDQDDRYINNKAIAGMHRAIVEDGTQIVEFNTYAQLVPHLPIYRCSKTYDVNHTFSKEDLMDGPILGVTMGRGNFFKTHVWSKIYLGDVARNSVVNINSELYYVEDAYLNLYAFTNSMTKNVSVRNEEYYIWMLGGFSQSKNAHMALLRDYCVTKVETIKILTKLKANSDIIFRIFSEGLWCYRAFINQAIANKDNTNELLNFIDEMEKTEYIRMTKEYFRTHPENIWTEEMNFMISDYTPQEYLDWCKLHLPKITYKEKIKSIIKKVLTI